MNNDIFQDYLLELLHLNSRYDILNTGSALDEIPMSRKIDLVKKMHPYSISAPTSEKGRWQTRFKDTNGNYKIIKAQTEEKLLKKLIPLYFSNSHLEKQTFYNLFEEWIDYKKELAERLYPHPSRFLKSARRGARGPVDLGPARTGAKRRPRTHAGFTHGF